MTKLQYYFNDGANKSAQAVLCLLKGFGEIEKSWDDDLKIYRAEINVARWENCREQGYVVSVRHKDSQLNIAFFEHRNSDNICAIRWEQWSINSLTIDTAKFGDIYKDKYDVSFEVPYDKHFKMAEWIYWELDGFWNEEESKSPTIKRNLV